MNVYRNLRNLVAGAGIGLYSMLGIGCNNAPTAKVTEPDGTEVRALTEDPYRIVLSLNRDDIINGLEGFVLHASDNDGPEVLTGTLYTTNKDNPVVAVIHGGTNSVSMRNINSTLRWPFDIVYTGNGNINRGTYDLFTIKLDDGWPVGRNNYTIVADVSTGTSHPGMPPEDNDNGHDDQMDDNDNMNDNGMPSIEDLLNQTYAEFVGNNHVPLESLNNTNFMVHLHTPTELLDSITDIKFKLECLGPNPCLNVDTLYGEPYNGEFIEPIMAGEVEDMAVYHVSGTLIKEENCDSKYEVLQAVFKVNLGNGYVHFNDSIVAKID